MTFKSLVPAMFAGARRAAAGPVDADEVRPDSIAAMGATVLAVLVVALIAVLLGMS